MAPLNWRNQQDPDSGPGSGSVIQWYRSAGSDPYQDVTDPEGTLDIPHSLLTSHGIVHGESLQLADGGILEGTELRQQRHIGRTVRHHVGVGRLGQVHVNRVQGVHAGRPGVVAQGVTLIRCVNGQVYEAIKEEQNHL